MSEKTQVMCQVHLSNGNSAAESGWENGTSSLKTGHVWSPSLIIDCFTTTNCIHILQVSKWTL